MNNIDISYLSLKPPRKYDEMYISKVLCKNNKCYLTFNNCKIVRIKNINASNAYLYLKLLPDQLKNYLDIEDVIVSLADQNLDSWFSSKIKPSLFEEYFQSSISVDKHYGKVLKCKLDDLTNVPDDEMTSQRIDITMKLHAVRFHKQSFNILWRIHEVKPTAPSFAFVDNDEDDDCLSETSFDFPDDAIVSIKSHLFSQLNSIETRTSTELSSLETKLKRVAEFKELLSVENITLNEIESISQLVNEWGV